MAKTKVAATASGLTDSPSVAGDKPKPIKRKVKGTVCPICDIEIKDSGPRSKGDDAVECEGVCGSWLHRQCAGLSKQAFAVVSKSEDPFLCAHCKVQQLELELKSVRTQLAHLASKLTRVDEVTTAPAVVSHASSPSPVLAATPLPVASDYVSSIPNFSRRESVDRDRSERKYNVVIFGIDEAPVGTSKLNRLEHDFEQVSTVLVQAESTFDVNSVRDHYRLGKFNRTHTRPRPLLVKLTRTSDVTKLLLKRANLQSPVSIKPDLPAAERAKIKALMDVRWSLMQSGTHKQDIKVRGNSLFVKGTLHASFRNGELVFTTPQTSINLPNVASPHSQQGNDSASPLTEPFPVPHLTPTSQMQASSSANAST